MKKENKDSSKSKIILSGILAFLLVISVIGITYAAFVYQKAGQKNNVITTGSIVFSYTENSNGIKLTNAMPTSDSVGKKLDNNEDSNNSFFDFRVSSSIAGTTRINYEVYATKENVENPLDDKYVKIYLTDGTTDQPISGYDSDVPTYYSLKDSTLVTGAKTLYTGSFTNSGVNSFRLRMWLADTYEVTAKSNEFKIKVNVKADAK